MQYYSLNQSKTDQESVEFAQAVIQGQAKDGGLYFPQFIPAGFELSDEQTLSDIAYQLLRPMIGTELSSEELMQLTTEVFSFPIPLVHLDQDLWVLELYHGPTGAFKDVGARFLARVMQKLTPHKLTILVATSGDTGGAVAHGFYGLSQIDVVILYPQGRVSPLQEKQLTGLGGNIQAIEIEGSFDDCQHLVKSLFRDHDLKQKRPLSSANSINIARWLPQSIYYAWASLQLRKQSIPQSQSPYFIVPSGNFGNLAAGLFAERRGLSTAGFLAACNRNSVFHDFLQSGQFQARKSVLTPSNAMDVGDPSNRPRIESLFENHIPSLQRSLHSATIDDLHTLKTIKEVYERQSYLLCPHTAVGYAALQQLRPHLDSAQTQAPKVLLATAHPAKFSETVRQATGTEVGVPNYLQANLKGQSNKITLPVDLQRIKSFLLNG